MKIPLTVAIPDYLRDHRYDGSIVLPAAEALQILAESLPDDLPRCDPRRQEGGNFAHLLRLDPDTESFGAFHEIAFFADGRRHSRLTTLRSGRQTQWTRSIEHLSVCFLPFEQMSSARRDHDYQKEIRDRAPILLQENRGSVPNFPGAMGKEGPSFSFSCRRLYADLVPFGPAYQNVVGEVSLTPAGGAATVSGGDCREADGPLGSPFPFDAAMHVACAWGQRYRNCVAFPVGFDRREIIHPTSAGETYRCSVSPLQDEGAILRFDIRLSGKEDRPAEIILGLRMRDISGGRLKPPAWVRKGV